MPVYAQGTAIIKHHKTHKQYEIPSDDLCWELVATNTRRMGMERIYSATIDHGELGELSWTVYEYSEGTENHKEHEINGHVLITDFDYGIR